MLFLRSRPFPGGCFGYHSHSDGVHGAGLHEEPGLLPGRAIRIEAVAECIRKMVESMKRKYFHRCCVVPRSSSVDSSPFHSLDRDSRLHILLNYIQVKTFLHIFVTKTANKNYTLKIVVILCHPPFLLIILLLKAHNWIGILVLSTGLIIKAIPDATKPFFGYDDLPNILPEDPVRMRS